jgi:hypothetical protein
MATPGERHLAMRQEERLRDEAGHKAGWTFLWTLFVFKIATVGIIWYAATSTQSHEISFIIATTWYWFVIPIIAISGPLLYRWRLVQQRRRREALRVAEWMDHRQGDDPPMTVADIVWEHDHRRA